MRSSFSMPLLYHAYVYLEFLILACTIYILAPRDATIFAAQTGLKMVKMRERRNKEEIKSRLTDRILNSKISFRDIFAWKRSDIK